MSQATDNVVARPRGDHTVIGLALMAAGVLWFLGELGVLHVAGRTMAAAALVAIGAGLIVTHRSGRRIWPLLVGGVLTIGLLGHSAGTAIGTRYGTALGSQDYVPTALNDVRPVYRVAAGAVHLDLTRVVFPSGAGRSIEIDVAAGVVNVIVPTGTALDVKAQDSVGAVTVFGSHLGSGVGVNREYRSPDWATMTGPRLVLNVNVVAGAVNVQSGAATPASVPPRPGAPGPLGSSGAA